MNPTQVERDRRLKAANAKRGLKQVSVWVPADRAQELKELAEKWRKPPVE